MHRAMAPAFALAAMLVGCNDSGGVIIDYARRAAVLKASGDLVKIKGRCDSACTLYLSLENICVTRRASFGFHLPYGVPPAQARIAATYMVTKYPDWARQWIVDNGGLTTKIKRMPYSTIRQHLPACN